MVHFLAEAQGALSQKSVIPIRHPQQADISSFNGAQWQLPKCRNLYPAYTTERDCNIDPHSAFAG